MTVTASRLGAFTTVAVAAGVLVAPNAVAAPTVTTRVASYAASTKAVTRGGTVTFTGQTQKLSGSRWVTAPGASVSVWFDADGSAPNRAVTTLKSTAAGRVAAKVTPPASGYWTMRINASGSLKAAVTVRTYVKVTTPTSYRPPKGSWTCPSWAPIKGNASSHIYHLPSGAFYARTKPEICFATESAAVHAGYRKSKR